MTYKIGFAEREINPTIGMELVGYLPRQGSMTCDGILDPLLVKALVIDDGQKQCIVLAYDLLGLDNNTVIKIKEQITKYTKLENKDIMIAATHTHSAPSASSYIPPDWEKHAEYITKLIDNTLEAFQDAQRNKADAKISFGLTNFNWNRYRIDDGRKVAPDQSVNVIKIDTLFNTIILFSYACHPVILNTSKASSDYVGYARRTIEQANMGGKTQTFSIFLNGCCGNINPYDPNKKEDLSGYEFQDVESMGKKLGNVVNEIIPKTSSLKERPIISKLECVRELTKVINLKQTSHPVYIQLIEFCSVRLIGMPGESFTETGSWIKEVSDTYTLPIGYANENVGYIPPAEYYDDVTMSVHRYHVIGAAEQAYGIIIPKGLEEDIRNKIRCMLNGTG